MAMKIKPFLFHCQHSIMVLPADDLAESLTVMKKLLFRYLIGKQPKTRYINCMYHIMIVHFRISRTLSFGGPFASSDLACLMIEVFSIRL